MNFGTETIDRFREQARDFVARHLTDEVLERCHERRLGHDDEFYRALASEGWMSASWPAEHGGKAIDAREEAAFIEELYAAGAPQTTINTTRIVAQTLIRVGSTEQQRRYLSAIATAQMLIALGYTESDAGSDLASVKTAARREGDHWVINGQKLFTTGADVASHIFLLARTRSDGPKHAGLTTFLVPTDAPGFSFTPIDTLGGERTCATYYDDVSVNDTDRVGEVDDAWRAVMGVALPAERSAQGLGTMRQMYAEAVRWAKTAMPQGRPIDNSLVRIRLARLAIYIEQTRLLNAASQSAAASGRVPLVESAMLKLFGSESCARAAGDLMNMLGAQSLLEFPDAPPGATSYIEAAFRYCPVTTVAGGSSELQRTIIARHALGLDTR